MELLQQQLVSLIEQYGIRVVATALGDAILDNYNDDKPLKWDDEDTIDDSGDMHTIAHNLKADLY